MTTLNRIMKGLAGGSLALAFALAAAPVTISAHGGLAALTAAAKDGRSDGSGGRGGSDGGGSHGGRGGSDDGGSDRGGSSDDGGSRRGGRGGADDGSSGHGGRSGGNASRESSGNQSSGRGRDHAEDDGGRLSGGADHARREDRSRRGDDRALRAGRAASSARGLEVVTRDGFKFEIEGGRFEIKDPSGRTVVERPATPADRAKVLNLIR